VVEALDFRLLGPLEVVGDDGSELAIGTGRQRALLALLVLRANELVPSDRLIEALWGHTPPPTAPKMLHNQISALRQALGRNGRLETQGSAYRLQVRPGELDVDRFEELIERARSTADPAAAADRLREALQLWRGPPLVDLAYESFAQPEIARLEERRWAAFEARVEAELALGRHADVIADLETAVREQPLREHLHGLLMLALYRCGRQAEALDAYRRARAVLVEEIGVEPGAELREVQASILAQDPGIGPPPITAEFPPPLEGGSPLLAGRAEELSELTRLLELAGEGRGGVVALSGPEGIGKTRLAAELARHALGRGFAVLYAAAGTAPPDALDAERRAERRMLLIVDELDETDAGLSRRISEFARETTGRPRLLALLCRGPDLPPELSSCPHARITLTPLDRDAVAEIARLYEPGEAEALPLETLMAESGGVPLAVHRVAAAWARARAAELVEERAGQAAEERGRLRAAEADLSGSVRALRSVDRQGRSYTAGEESAPARAVCPFVGLATFDAAHAEYFFGRERLVSELIARLVGSRLVAVIGPSGSGKSSVVRAGLLPQLAEGVLPGSDGWQLALMRPGEHPLGDLRKTLPESGEHVLLVVDQFEEVFTACRDERERAAFLDAIVELAEDRDRNVQVLIAMRADFYGSCAAHPALARLVAANQVLVGPMQRDELRAAIEEPARRVGLRVEPSLTDALIADVIDEPGGLPLLSAALVEQWREREGRAMRRAAYERTGGVRGAVGRLAEQTYTRLSEPEREQARRILLRLADAGRPEAGLFVRRRMPLDEIDPEPDTHTAAALATLIDSRLVTVEEDSLEVAHEALLREWPRLRAWLEEDAEGRRLHQHLIHAARDWDTAGREPGELYRGARLAAALDWAAGHGGDLNELERAFLDESRAAAEQEVEHQRRANRRLRGLLAGAAALLAVAVVAGIVALNQRGEARDAVVTADAQRLGAEAVNEDRLDQALLLARTGVELDDSTATRSSLLSVLLRSPASLGVLDYGWPMNAAALSRDSRLMAIGDERGSVTVYDAATRRPLGRPYWIREGLIQDLRFSPDGRTLAVSSGNPDNRTRSGLVDLIDPRTKERRLRVVPPPFRVWAPWTTATVTFLPGGDLVVQRVHGAHPEGPSSVLYRVDGNTGALTDRLRLGESSSYYYASATAEGRRLFMTSAGDNRTWEVDPERLNVLRSWPVGDFAGTVSPDGRRFALGSPEGRVRMLDLGSGSVRPFRGRHDEVIIRMRFTADGRTLVTSGGDGQVIAWDAWRGTIAQRFAGHNGGIWGLDLSADGRTMLTAGLDTRAILWDLAGDRRLDRRFPVRRRFDFLDRPRGIAVSPDGRTLAFTHSDGTVDLIDTRTLRRRGSLQAIDGKAASVDFSPDGRLLAVTGAGGRLTLWNSRTLAPAGELEGMRGDSQALAFSPGGRLIAAAEVDVRKPRPLRVWNVRRRTLTAFRGRTAAGSIAFSPDGQLIASAAIEQGTDIRDVRTGRFVKRLPLGDFEGVGDFARSVAFSPGGDLLFVAQYDGRGYLYSTETWKLVGQPLEGHTARITFAEFSSDRRTLVTAAADGTVVLWDVATRKPIGSPLEVVPGTFASVALSPDGSRLFAVSTRGQGISFDISPEAWKRHACLVAGRDFSAREWEDALPEQPYQAVCSDG
jgi:WD40 repeat protein/DNA-binding SARP family transcriptional activator